MAAAVDFRLQGHTYDEIADELKLGGTSTAHDLVTQALAAIPKESAESYLAMELARCYKLLTGFMADAVGGDDTKLRSVQAIVERLDKLMGIVAPAQRVELSGPNGGPVVTAEITDEARAKALATFIAKFTARKEQGDKS